MAAYKYDPPKHIVITGASSGIGKALALHYAAPEVVLALTGRNAERLESIAQECMRKGARVVHVVLDVTNKDGMMLWLYEFDAAYPIDLVIANAGISGGTGAVMRGEDHNQIYNILDVNLYGVINTITPVQQKMTERARGQIAIISSLAGYRGWPGAPAYCASKAAVRIYGEALRGVLRKSNIRVNVVCPGFVKSRMTDVNDFPMPFLIEAESAAKIIAKGLERNRGRLSFPCFSAGIAWFLMVIPDVLAQYILSNSPAKPINHVGKNT